MLLRIAENLLDRLGPGRVRRVEHPLKPLFLQYLGRGLRSVHAQLVHIERHPSEWILGTQLLDEVGKLILVDGLGEGHEQIESVFLRDSDNTSDSRHIQQSTVAFQRFTRETPGTVEEGLLREHYLVDVHDIVVIGLYPGQFLVALAELFLYPFGVTAFPDFADSDPLYLDLVFSVEPPQYPETHALSPELGVEQANPVCQG